MGTYTRCYAIYTGASSDLHLDNYLKSLPTDKKIVVYCYTGQTSAQTSAYLGVLGYDAYSLLYGVNAMDRDNVLPQDVMQKLKFTIIH